MSGAVLIAGGLGFGIGARIEGDAVSDESRKHLAFDPSREDFGKAFQEASIGCYIVGGLLVAVGVTGMLLRHNALNGQSRP
jgi:hypothetical protein